MEGKNSLGSPADRKRKNSSQKNIPAGASAGEKKKKKSVSDEFNTTEKMTKKNKVPMSDEFKTPEKKTKKNKVPMKTSKDWTVVQRLSDITSSTKIAFVKKGCANFQAIQDFCRIDRSVLLVEVDHDATVVEVRTPAEVAECAASFGKLHVVVRDTAGEDLANWVENVAAESEFGISRLRG